MHYFSINMVLNTQDPDARSWIEGRQNLQNPYVSPLPKNKYDFGSYYSHSKLKVLVGVEGEAREGSQLYCCISVKLFI